MEQDPRFLADEMLGSLARWLRIAGYDAAYVKDLTDGEILELARQEDRILLTRDRQLAERAGGHGLLITTPDLDGQMEQVITVFHLKLDRPLSRCTLCNAPVEEVPPEVVEGRVPERVWERNREFYICRGCGQIYWKGSHWQRMNEKLDRLRADNSPH